MSPQDTEYVAARITGYFEHCASPSPAVPGKRLRRDTTDLAHAFLELMAGVLDQRTVPDSEKFDLVRTIASRWARDGVALSAILRTCHKGLRIVFGLIIEPATAEDVDAILITADLVHELLEMITAVVTDAYLEQRRLVVTEQQTAAQTLASALLSGHGSSALARQTGIPIAESYQVVALAIPAHPEEKDPQIDSDIVARRTLHKLQSELTTVFTAQALALLSTKGGTVLIPLDEHGGTDFGTAALELLADAAEVPLTATVVPSGTDRIPEAADQAHELLNLARACARPPGLYRMSDLAIEYQLTHSGTATQRIATILDPLDSHPELFDTVRVYLRNDMNRQLTARQLYVHPNTVDYRLRRVAQLTSIDLATSAGISYATVALLARDLDGNITRRP
ncbi:PucR family transcriptional regulator [Nocardia sp. 004]|uniref:PucR family transcriptional regulator n=1 Tax=Nocardia sp. 004 TaxID=3385978 RepID=UPI0039A3D166